MGISNCSARLYYACMYFEKACYSYNHTFGSPSYVCIVTSWVYCSADVSLQSNGFTACSVAAEAEPFLSTLHTQCTCMHLCCDALHFIQCKDGRALWTLTKHWDQPSLDQRRLGHKTSSNSATHWARRLHG